MHFIAAALIKSLEEKGLSTTYVVDADGRVLLHPNLAKLSDAISENRNPLFVKAREKISRAGVLKFKDESGQEFVGSFAHIGLADLTALSQIESVRAFGAIRQLLKRSLVFALAVLTFTFLVILFFARTLTEPLVYLMNAMKRVSSGDLTQKIEVKTRDELSVLGQVFNEMTGDLKKSRHELLELNRSLEEKVKERTKQLEEAAIKDALTNLYNRRFFNDRLSEEFKRSQRNKKPVSIVYMDIDHFKKFNDQNGHPEGDVLLKMFAKVILDSVRESDSVCRIGGEEFCIILPETDIKGAQECAEKVRKSVEATNFPHGEKQPLGRVTCSLGVSSFPEYSRDAEEIVKSADEGLYHAKEGGRNRVGTPNKKPVAA